MFYFISLFLIFWIFFFPYFHMGCSHFMIHVNSFFSYSHIHCSKRPISTQCPPLLIFPSTLNTVYFCARLLNRPIIVFANHLSIHFKSCFLSGYLSDSLCLLTAWYFSPVFHIHCNFRVEACRDILDNGNWNCSHTVQLYINLIRNWVASDIEFIYCPCCFPC